MSSLSEARRRVIAASAALLLLSAPAPLRAEDDCSAALNFEDVEIGALIDEMADRTGAKFIVDPRVAGRVTIVSANAGGLCADEVLDAFLAALPANGFKATEVAEGAYRIAPAAAIAQQETERLPQPTSVAASKPPALRRDDAGAKIAAKAVPASESKQGTPADPSDMPMESVFFGAHLASYRTESGAVAGWKELRAEYPIELDAMTARIAEHQDSRGKFERVIAGPFPSRAEAGAFCGRLKEAGAWCAVMPFSGRPLPQ